MECSERDEEIRMGIEELKEKMRKINVEEGLVELMEVKKMYEVMKKVQEEERKKSKIGIEWKRLRRKGTF